MITKEQAEQAWKRYTEDDNMLAVYEHRNVTYEPVQSSIIGNDDYPVADDEGGCYYGATLEELVWLVTYERRYRYGSWPWHEAFCFIVVPKPVPFVMEGN